MRSCAAPDTGRETRRSDDPDLLQRILLVTDGTVTNILEAYAHEPIRIVKLRQSIEPCGEAIPDLELPAEQDVMRREVLLQGRYSGRTLVYAVSQIVPHRLTAAIRQGLLESTKPIGLLLEESRAETFREILRSGPEPAGARGPHFGLPATAELMSRTYRVLAGGRPIMLITEKFPAHGLSRDGATRGPGRPAVEVTGRARDGAAPGAPAAAGMTVWLTGLPGAGKSTLAVAVAEELRRRGRRVEVLDGDVMRSTLSAGLGFSRADREANVRRIGLVAETLTRHGVTAVVAAIAPYRAVRNEVRRRIAREGRFVEVWVRCPVAELIRRDRTGDYRRALEGSIANFTGVSDPYEEPSSADVVLDTDVETVERSLGRVLEVIDRSG